eukprot:CAMPEP_0197833890 /NCGR_PEP_ID=MMETSP1437-20131217/20464_1 /TAXON_ID=49252 ORGANISM="Eucampia antarctica, Strain CCMP1452" /NCGR_SAMPLE_ID=MMETSP1437 /ASSEMBLY_ACC=CAM_ASM_001096 /LENGTH=715 /DNA_ID=CAMNT_0043438199 /DNA_START=462 /DNA_END=2609 /DNA_ORIENTATION=+
MSISANGKVQRTSGDLKIFVKDVTDKQAKKRPITVKTWSTVKDVKDVLQQHLHVPASAQRLFFRPSGGELPNHRSLQDAGIYRSGETLLLEIFSDQSSSKVSLTSLNSSTAPDICISSSTLDLTHKSLRSTVQQARRGLALGLKPALVLDGSGGSYFFRNARQSNVAIFKPADEEPYAENNPRGYVKSDQMSMRDGIQPGEACLREVAAYLIDHQGFSSVPMTTLVEARHPAFNHNGSMMKLTEGGASLGNHALSTAQLNTNPHKVQKKVGSFQAFVKAECSMDDLSPSMLSVEEVHKIAILDIRILNADRNSANLLVRRKPDNTLELVPIDHGYCLRTVSDVCWFDWCWLDWPQLKEPLSKRSREYILKLDIEADARLLRERLHIPIEALDYFRATSRFLKAGVKAGMTLYDIAVICCRNDDCGELPSKLENLSAVAKELASAAVRNGRWHHAAASRALADQLSAENNQHHISSLFKSKSSVSLHVSDHMKPTLHAPHRMAFSSGSDSSSDNGDVDQEECEEWAAAIIAEARVEAKSPLDLSHRQRAVSFGNEFSEQDDSSKSTDGGGFWHIAPNEDVADDSSWSPSYVSPKLSPKDNSRPSVSFDVPTILLPPLSLALSPIQISAPAKGIQRSLSYSAFSFPSKPISNDLNRRGSTSSSVAIDDDQYRLYLLKYLDLLIKSETISHSRSRQDSVTSELSTPEDYSHVIKLTGM